MEKSESSDGTPPFGGETELLDWYQRLRRRIQDTLKSRAESGSTVDGASERLVTYLSLLPDLFHLGVRLIFDREVPAANKGALIAAVAYVVSPIDLIPDAIPVAGWIDDLIAMALGLNRFLDTQDDAAAKSVAKYWAGDQDVFETVKHILEIAEEAVTFLPKTVLGMLKGVFPKVPKGGKAS